MSLARKFKTDASTSQSGVWIDYDSSPNDDGSVPGFKLARMHKQNKNYARAIRKATKGMTNDDGTIDTEGVDDSEAELALLNVFLETVLLDWRNFEPNGDGEKAVFTPQAARAVMGSSDWVDLYDDLTEKAQTLSTFSLKKLEAQAKNS